MTQQPPEPLPPALFDRTDDSNDALFYQSPRLVAHIDEKTIEALTEFYREKLFDGADVLDLMSSWISHLPEDIELGNVSGLGMNQPELEANRRLSSHVVHDLNIEPTLPYANDSYDFVLIAVSIQYLIRPLEVFAEIARVLRSQGQVIIATSHRCFPTKAIRAFQQADPNDRLQLIAEYIRRTQQFIEPRLDDRSPSGADPLWIVSGQRK
jgi:SAM-dependent methyltransferase